MPVENSKRALSLRRVTQALCSAFTRQEIADSFAAFSWHKKRFAEDAHLVADDLCPAYSRIAECADLRHRQANDMNLTLLEGTEREQMLKATQTAPQKEDALQILYTQQRWLESWLIRHPNDSYAHIRLETISEEIRFHSLFRELDRAGDAQGELLLQKR